MEGADGKMRLTCPNCTAQYEVPDDVIPEDGRDVQCSNCGNTWFQAHASAEEPASDDGAQDAVWHPEVDDSADHGPSINAGADPTGDDGRQHPPERRGLDPSVADILKEEAELEARAREADALEDQPELGLSEPEDEASKRARQARERMLRMRGEAPEEAAASAVAAVATRPKSRGDALPDIDEINQTLRSNDQRSDVSSVQSGMDDEDAPGGFGRGFFYMLVLFAIATALYVFAPQISEAVPQAAPYMDSYVSAVDQLRLWLDAQVTSLLAMLDGMSSEAGAEAE